MSAETIRTEDLVNNFIYQHSQHPHSPIAQITQSSTNLHMEHSRSLFICYFSSLVRVKLRASHILGINYSCVYVCFLFLNFDILQIEFETTSQFHKI